MAHFAPFSLTHFFAQSTCPALAPFAPHSVSVSQPVMVTWSPGFSWAEVVVERPRPRASARMASGMKIFFMPALLSCPSSLSLSGGFCCRGRLRDAISITPSRGRPWGRLPQRVLERKVEDDGSLPAAGADTEGKGDPRNDL